jgi:inhibitor of KinA sporulation pathway (predicted exonuclease)
MNSSSTYSSVVYLDLEWDGGRRLKPGVPPEIIEIGLVELDCSSLAITREENYLVRPKCINVSPLCTKVTGISRDDLRDAPMLSDVIATISGKWPAKAPCFAWGDDGELLKRACHVRHLAAPFRRFVDLGMLFQKLFLLP